MMGLEIDSVYPPVIEAIAQRLFVAETELEGVRKNLQYPLAWVGCEIATLQLRAICELFLIGSTLAHIHEGGVQLDDTRWRPKDAFAQLGAVSEHPLPLPVSINLNKNGPGAHHIDPLSQPLPFSVLSRIYGICGDLLHIPTARQVVKDKKPSFDLERLEGWVAGFKGLTKAHVLMLPERKKVLLCRWSGDLANKPELSLLNAMGESTFRLSEYPPFELLS